MPDLISGQAHVMVNAIPELLPHTKGGRLRVIGSMTERRHPDPEEIVMQQVVDELTRLYLSDIRDPLVREALDAASVVRRTTGSVS